MHDVVVGLSSNILKVSIIDPKVGLSTYSVKLGKDVVDDSRIINCESFAVELGNAISQITLFSKNKLSLVFMVDAHDVQLKFLTVSKRDEDLDSVLKDEVFKKLPDINIEEMYFSYQKIAPFLYQFVAINQELLEKYLKVANLLGIGIKGVISWVTLLPRYVKADKPVIFIVQQDNSETIAMSEMGGIFFAENYEGENKPKNLTDLTKDLSLYKRSSPIKTVYTLNYDDLKIDDYEVVQVEIPEFELGQENLKGFELNVITNFALDTDNEILFSQHNLLNLLPLPVEQKKSTAVVAASVTFASLLIVAGIFGGLMFLRNKEISTNEQLANNDETSVLSETISQVDESTQTEAIEDSQVTETEEEETEEEDVLGPKREDLVIRIENGSGINGLAGDTRDFLKDLGYMILEIDTATINTKETILRFKEDRSDYGNLVSADMKEKFPEIVVENTLNSEVDYDLLIIVGSTSEL